MSLYRLYKRWEERRRYQRWVARGRLLPPPHVVKRVTVKDFAEQFHTRVLVETGTYKGDMVKATLGCFDKIYTIELDATLCAAARELFSNHPEVQILQGDSACELPKVLAELREPALFWLDGHYTGDHAGKAELHTPIARELECLFAHPVKGHVILIDDARLFNGKNDYPTIASLREMAKAHAPQLNFEVCDDTIRIYP